MRHSRFEYTNPKQTHLFEKSIEDKEKEEREKIGVAYNIYGDALNRLKKIDGQWKIDGQTLEEYKESQDRIHSKDSDFWKN